MQEARNRDGETPFARAEVEHRILLESGAARDRVLVLIDSIVDSKEIDRRQNAATQEIRSGDRLEIVLAEARLDLMQGLNGCSSGFCAEPAIAGDLCFAEGGTQRIEIDGREARAGGVRADGSAG